MDPPDLVLLDLMMPPLDGATVCRQLRADPRTRDVSVLFLTVVPEPRVRALLDGDCADGYLAKPCDIDDLLDAVARLSASAAGKLH